MNEWRAALNAARERWGKLGITSYRYHARLSCFCRFPVDVTLTVYRDHLVEVRNRRDGSIVSLTTSRFYLTITEIFDLIENAIDLPADYLAARYDQTMGNPVDVEIDYARIIADEEIGIRIDELEVITPPPFTATPQQSATFTPTVTATPMPTATVKPFHDNGDGTLTDVRYNLTWEKKASHDGVPNYDDLHDADNVYAWVGACRDLSYCQPGGCGPGLGPCSALRTTATFLAELNDSGFAGYGDWRMPTPFELDTLFDQAQFYADPRPPAPHVHVELNTPRYPGTCFDVLSLECSQTVPAAYWSGMRINLPHTAWSTRFSSPGDGVNAQDIRIPFRVRAVRGEVVEPRY